MDSALSIGVKERAAEGNVAFPATERMELTDSEGNICHCGNNVVFMISIPAFEGFSSLRASVSSSVPERSREGEGRRSVD